jgi:hypothetical protein
VFSGSAVRLRRQFVLLGGLPMRLVHVLSS